MSNILLNPALTGFSAPPRVFTDRSGNTGYIENPDHWEFVWTPMHADDPNRIPQSLHRDRGYCIAAGWRVWEAGYVQRGVRLRAGQRYLAKAVFRPDVNFPNGPENLTSVQWRFWIQAAGSDEKAFADWQITGKGVYKQEEEHLFVIEARADMAADVYFKARSTYADNVCDFNLYSLTLEEVPQDYGTPAYLGDTGGAPAEPPPTPEEPPAPPPVAGLYTVMLSGEDIDVIVDGLRAMSQVTPNAAVVAAFDRLADVLERVKTGGVG